MGVVMMNKDQVKADLYFQIALRTVLKCDNEPYLTAMIHYNFGLNCQRLNKVEKARVNLEYALEYFELQNAS